MYPGYSANHAIILFASEAQRAAICAMRRLLHDIREKRTAEYFDEIVNFQEREQIVNTAHYQELQERFLSLE